MCSVLAGLAKQSGCVLYCNFIGAKGADIIKLDFFFSATFHSGPENNCFFISNYFTFL